MRPYDAIRYRLIAGDPGQTRLLTALRALLAVVLTLAIMSMIDNTLKLPPTVQLLGAALAMQASIAVNDRLRKEQRVTTFLLPLAAAPSVLIAIAASLRYAVYPGVGLSICVATASAFAIRYFAFPDRADRGLRLAIMSFQAGCH